MKKLSISVFAILTIIFAVSSAFTASKVAKHPGRHYFILHDASTVSFATFSATGTSAVDGFQNVATYIEDMPLDFNEVGLMCDAPGSEDVVCAYNLLHENDEFVAQSDLDNLSQVVEGFIVYRDIP